MDGRGNDANDDCNPTYELQVDADGGSLAREYKPMQTKTHRQQKQPGTGDQCRAPESDWKRIS